MADSNQKTQFRFKKYTPSVDQDVSGSPWKRVTNHRLFRLIMGAMAGAVVGLLYWKFVGCNSGTCPLTASPYQTVIIFTFMGGLLARDKPGEKAP